MGGAAELFVHIGADLISDGIALEDQPADEAEDEGNQTHDHDKPVQHDGDGGQFAQEGIGGGIHFIADSHQDHAHQAGGNGALRLVQELVGGVAQCRAVLAVFVDLVVHGLNVDDLAGDVVHADGAGTHAHTDQVDRRQALQQAHHLQNKEDTAGHKLHHDEDAVEPDGGTDGLHDGAGQQRTDDQREEHHQRGDHRKGAQFGGVHGAGGQVGAVGPFGVVGGGCEQEGPDEAGEQHVGQTDAQSAVGLDHAEDVGDLDLVLLGGLGDMPLLDQGNAQQRQHRRNEHHRDDGHAEGVMHAVQAQGGVDAVDDHDDGRPHHADDHVQGAGRDEQLAAVVGIQRQGAVDQVGRVEGGAHVIQQVEYNDPDADHHRVVGENRRQREQPAQAGRRHQDTQKDKRAILAVFGDLSAVHQPPLKGVVDRIKKTGKHQQAAAQYGTPLPDAGVVGQVQHEQSGHNSGGQTIGDAHGSRSEIIAELQLAGLFWILHCVLSFCSAFRNGPIPFTIHCPQYSGSSARTL